MIKNKRGQGLSTNAIILIVLGVIVLVILALGFIMGWDKIAPWIKPKNNVQVVVDACSMACLTSSAYDYCTLKRELKTDGLPDNLKSATESCDYFSKTAGYESFKIAKCPSIPC